MICQVQNTALSGLESYVITQRQAQLLDTAVANAGRAALRGKASWKDDNGKITASMSAHQVLHYWAMASCMLELRVRRLKWLQKIAKYPEHHAMPLAARFSNCKGEEDDEELVCVLPKGLLGPGASPWTIQAYDDIAALREIDSGADALYGIGNAFLKVFTGRELADEFASIDVEELRRKEISCSVPPPEFHVEEDIVQADVQHAFACSACDFKSHCRQGLLSHMRKVHNIRLLSYVATASNSCGVCK